MKITEQCVVAFHYTLTDDSGQALDSSAGREPLVYLHGASAIIPGLEQQLEGREAGDKIQATVAPELAYGEADPRLIQEVPLSALQGIEDLQVGMALQSQTSDGRVQRLTVDAIGEESATLNANHPLAGRTLHFDVSIETVRPATAEEIEHGHAH